MKLPASFPLPIRLEWTAPRMGKFTAPFAYVSPSIGKVEIEAGFDTDFASVPRGLWNLYPPDGPWSPAAFIHDALYWHQALREGGLPVTREQADKVFLEAMKDLGIGWVTRSILYRAVRFGGGTAWLDNQRRKAGLPPLTDKAAEIRGTRFKRSHK
jgi:hypothetical protein